MAMTGSQLVNPGSVSLLLGQPSSRQLSSSKRQEKGRTWAETSVTHNVTMVNDVLGANCSILSRVYAKWVWAVERDWNGYLKTLAILCKNCHFFVFWRNRPDFAETRSKKKLKYPLKRSQKWFETIQKILLNNPKALQHNPEWTKIP